MDDWMDLMEWDVFDPVEVLMVIDELLIYNSVIDGESDELLQ